MPLMSQSSVFVLPLLRDQLAAPVDAFVCFFRARLADGVKVAFEVRGFDADPRELYEVPEVCAWIRELFILTMPEALAALAATPGAPGLALVEACCNHTRRHALGVSVEILPAWLDACAQAGVPLESEQAPRSRREGRRK